PIPAPVENVSPGNLQVPEGAPIPAPVENVSPGNLQVPESLPKPPAFSNSQENSLDLNEELPDVPSQLLLEIQSSVAPFIYEYGDEKDPFDDPTIKDSDTNVVIIPKTPPEEYELNQIKLKGIIWHTKTPKALFQLPGSAGFYTLIKGDKIGKNGVVFGIREDEVIIVETNYVGSGENRKEEITTKLIKLDRLNLLESSQG
ncbi:MAG: pilus assembly protein PilP, partial [Bdellovibrionaceae bacterium]|nr:pilus assembly protein PilP [Pseudobdellovibrionaceae bacterium]